MINDTKILQTNRQAQVRGIEGLGLETVPEHEAPLRSGKPERSGNRDEKEYEIGLKSTLEQTILRKKLDTTVVTLGSYAAVHFFLNNEAQRAESITVERCQPLVWPR